MNNKFKTMKKLQFEIVHDPVPPNGEIRYRFSRLIAKLPNGGTVQVASENLIPEYDEKRKDGERSEYYLNLIRDSFLASDQKAFKSYGTMPSHDPKELVDYLKGKGWKFKFAKIENRKEYDEDCKNDDVWTFHGNVVEYSAAFSYEIFDEELAIYLKNYLKK